MHRVLSTRWLSFLLLSLTALTGCQMNVDVQVTDRSGVPLDGVLVSVMTESSGVNAGTSVSAQGQTDPFGRVSLTLAPESKPDRLNFLVQRGRQKWNGSLSVRRLPIDERVVPEAGSTDLDTAPGGVLSVFTTDMGSLIADQSRQMSGSSSPFVVIATVR